MGMYLKIYMLLAIAQGRLSCCRVCEMGQACGDACINAGYTCKKTSGCACDGNTCTSFCVDGKACGDKCIPSTEKCTAAAKKKATSSAVRMCDRDPKKVGMKKYSKMLANAMKNGKVNKSQLITNAIEDILPSDLGELADMLKKSASRAIKDEF